jgi:RND family efflux transporter MFP subunit
MKHARALVSVALAGALATAVMWRLTQSADDAPTPDPAVSPADEFGFAGGLPIAAEAVPVVRDTLVMTVYAGGRAAAARKTVVTARVSGRVTAVPAMENDRIVQGGLLAELEPTELRLDLRRAQADSIAAWNRYRLELMSDTIIEMEPAVRATRERMARERAGIELTHIALERARYNLSHAHVTAPFAGRIADVRVVPGQYVAAGAEIATVLDLNPIHIQVNVLEGYLSLVEPGRGATAEFPALAAETFRGAIETMNPMVDEFGMARVTITLPNPAQRILPGFFVNATLDAKRYADRTLVPLSALVERDGERPGVFLFEGTGDVGTAVWTPVRTGLRNHEYVELLDDPSDPSIRVPEPGVFVLVGGHAALADGARVRLAGATSGRAP